MRNNNSSENISVQIVDNLSGTLKKKKGTYEDTKDKKNQDMLLDTNKVRVGLSKGVTINMGDFQSARIDVWISKVCDDNKVEIEETLNEISKIIDERIEYEANQLLTNEE